MTTGYTEEIIVVHSLDHVRAWFPLPLRADRAVHNRHMMPTLQTQVSVVEARGPQIVKHLHLVLKYWGLLSVKFIQHLRILRFAKAHHAFYLSFHQLVAAFKLQYKTNMNYAPPHPSGARANWQEHSYAWQLPDNTVNGQTP